MATVFAHILTWNDHRYLPDLFESIEAQTYKGLNVRILDNGSTDKTVDYLQEHYPHYIVGRNARNNGFAGGHNQLFRFTVDHLNGEDPDRTFILVANSDMIWKPDVVDRLVRALEANDQLAAVQPKIYRAFADHHPDDTLTEVVLSDILDTTGLSVKKGWRMSDRGAGELDEGQYDEMNLIFCATGTMSLFRLSALQSVLTEGELFDPDFFAYREDCDLAWRLARAGWKSEFVPLAVAHHYRGMFGAEKQSLWQRFKNRRGQRPFFAALSTRNQLLLLIKNLSFIDALLSAPWILVGESIRVAYGFFFEPMTRKRLLEIPRLLPSMLRRRKEIFSREQIDGSILRAYVE